MVVFYCCLNLRFSGGLFIRLSSLVSVCSEHSLVVEEAGLRVCCKLRNLPSSYLALTNVKIDFFSYCLGNLFVSWVIVPYRICL